jgi:REP element-mobilizing transposase RayT
MPRSFSAVNIHFVFSTKDRRPFLSDPSFREEVHAYMGGIIKRLECTPVIIGGVSDHVHMLVGLAKTANQSDLMKEVKRNSSSWIKEREPTLRDFSWQGGYGAFSVDVTSINRIRIYILNQESHHKSLSFQDEFRALLIEQGIEIDERYLWD